MMYQCEKYILDNRRDLKQCTFARFFFLTLDFDVVAKI